MNGSPLEVRPGEREANAVVQMAHLLEFQYGAMIKVMEDMRERGVDVRGPLERAGLADFMEKVGLL